VPTFKPISEAQLQAIVSKTKEAATTGMSEPFKTTTQFDGTAEMRSQPFSGAAIR